MNMLSTSVFCLVATTLFAAAGCVDAKDPAPLPTTPEGRLQYTADQSGFDQSTPTPPPGFLARASESICLLRADGCTFCCLWGEGEVYCGYVNNCN